MLLQLQGYKPKSNSQCIFSMQTQKHHYQADGSLSVVYIFHSKIKIKDANFEMIGKIDNKTSI